MTEVDGVRARVPFAVRIRLAHAAVQALANEASVELLHIKGAAVDASLRSSRSSGSDVDVLVRPDQLENFDRLLHRRGWSVYSTFVYGSPFGHAQTYLHDDWGYLDLHRFFPGVDVAPEGAFARLWADRQSIEIGGVTCSVPALPAQMLILMLNAARLPGASGFAAVDVSAWEQHRAEVGELVTELDAVVAFAAATGTLERYRRDRRYLLWKVASQGGGRFEEWRARVRAAPDFWAGLRIAARAPLVNVDRLTHRLGHRPTRREVAIEFAARPIRGLHEVWQKWRQ